MQYQEISLQALITYMEGSASEAVREQIDEQRENNPDFAEEFEDWEAFLEAADSREAGIEQMKSFQKEWQDTALDTSVVEPEAKVVQFEAAIKKKVKADNQNNFSLYAKIGIAACVLILLTVVGRQMIGGTSLGSEVNDQFSQRLESLLSNKAGTTSAAEQEAFNEQLYGQIKEKEYEAALQSLDSLLETKPGPSNYILVKAMLLSLADKDQQAIAFLNEYKDSPAASSLSCNILSQLAKTHAKQGDKQAFDKMVEEFNQPKASGYSCADEDKKVRKELESLGAKL